MLTAADCAPDSVHFNGLPWMQDIEGSIEKGTIKSIRTLKDKWGTDNMTKEEACVFQSGFRKTNTSKIKEQEKIILDGRPHEVILAFQNSPLACKLCNQAFFQHHTHTSTCDSKHSAECSATLQVLRMTAGGHTQPGHNQNHDLSQDWEDRD